MEVPEAADQRPEELTSRPRSLRAVRLRDEAERRRKRWWIPFAIGGGLVLTLALLIWIQSLPVRWKTLRCEEGDFSVDFPANPAVNHLPVDGAKGLVVHQFFYGSWWDDEFYAVNYLDCPPEKVADREALFDAIGADWFQRIDEVVFHPDIGPTKIVKTAPYAFQGFPGREMTIDIESCPATGSWSATGSTGS